MKRAGVGVAGTRTEVLLVRAAWLALALSGTSVLILARALEPDPRGFGTHLALGLPPCGFLAWLGVACPTCGLTTAFAQLARFELMASLRAHPLGVPLFGLTFAGSLFALRGALRAEPLGAALARLRGERWLLVLALALLVSWVARLVARV